MWPPPWGSPGWRWAPGRAGEAALERLRSAPEVEWVEPVILYHHVRGGGGGFRLVRASAGGPPKAAP